LAHTHKIKQKKKILCSRQRKGITHPSNTNILFYSKGIFLWFLQGENPKVVKKTKKNRKNNLDVSLVCLMFFFSPGNKNAILHNFNKILKSK